jgi:hypothetical protein
MDQELLPDWMLGTFGGGQAGETWQQYRERRLCEDGQQIVEEHGQHLVDKYNIEYRAYCGQCGGELVTEDGSAWTHAALGVEPRCRECEDELYEREVAGGLCASCERKLAKTASPALD